MFKAEDEGVRCQSAVAEFLPAGGVEGFGLAVGDGPAVGEVEGFGLGVAEPPGCGFVEGATVGAAEAGVSVGDVLLLLQPISLMMRCVLLQAAYYYY